jgi:hypothetical protein
MAQPRHFVGLLYCQAIHTRPQPDRDAMRRTKGRLSENADHTSLPNVAMNVAAELSKLAGDELRRAVLPEAKLGVCMQVLPPGGHIAVKQIDQVWDLQDERLQHGMLRTGTPMFASRTNAVSAA